MPGSALTLVEIQNELAALGEPYECDKIIGAGSYGVVVHARDMENGGCEVALKRINDDIFTDFELSMRILREIELLNHFNDDNIVRLRNIILPSEKAFDHIYIVMDAMYTDLRRVLRSHQPLTEEHARFLTYQMLRALHVIHSAGVIHRDITPSNILLNVNCDLKICDFGLAREETASDEYMTDYVTMRWYRAPELVMEEGKYTGKVDVWSVGCILGEILGSPVLFPGRDRVNQLDKIIEVLGTPSKSTMLSMGSRTAQGYLEKKSHRPPIDWREKYPKASEKALDFLQRMLVFDPEDRITVLDALRHPFLESLYDETDIVTAEPFVFNKKVSSLKDVKAHIIVVSKQIRLRLKNQKLEADQSDENVKQTYASDVERSGEKASADEGISTKEHASSRQLPA